MSESESLLDSNPFVRARVAKAYAEALAGALQEALVMAVESRFPALLDLARERAKLAQQPDALKGVLRGIYSASSEEIARAFLNSLAP